MRQGDVITGLQTTLSNDHNVPYLVITHCCSLARKDPIELLPCRALSSHDGMMTRGKNPRKLHFLVEPQWYEIVAHEKILCEPEHIKTATLIYTAKEDEREILQHWLASGYRRQALDDTTAEMINWLKLKSLVSTYGTDLQGVWVSSQSLSEV